MDIPPTVSCAHCGRQDCEGSCAASSRPSFAATAGGVGGFFTALEDSVVGYDVWGAELGRRSLWGVFAFAVLAELAAASSLCALFGGLNCLITGRGPTWSDGVAIGIWSGGLALTLVALHLLWGASLEALLVLSGRAQRLRQTLAFALYACGWDAITSPAGYALATRFRGFARACRLVILGTQVPRLALTRYLSVERGVSPHLALGLAVGSFVLPALAACALAGFVLWRGLVEYFL